MQFFSSQYFFYFLSKLLFLTLFHSLMTELLKFHLTAEKHKHYVVLSYHSLVTGVLNYCHICTNINKIYFTHHFLFGISSKIFSYFSLILRIKFEHFS